MAGLAGALGLTGLTGLAALAGGLADFFTAAALAAAGLAAVLFRRLGAPALAAFLVKTDLLATVRPLSPIGSSCYAEVLSTSYVAEGT